MSKYDVTINGVTYLVDLLKRNGEEISFTVDGQNYDVRVSRKISETRIARSSHHITQQTPVATSTGSQMATTPSSPGEVTAPIPGILSSIKVSVGDQVTVGDTVAVIEAMKMENPIRAHCNGKVTQIYGKAGDEVKVGTALVTIDNT
jgi:biotin carboxyl carrier protein